MKGTNKLERPKFLEGVELPNSYYETPNPYKTAPSCNVDLLELSRYARKIGKKLVELTKEEVQQFAIV
jgi:hypothetical protein